MNTYTIDRQEMETNTGIRFIARCSRPAKTRTGVKQVFGYYFQTNEAREKYINDFLAAEEKKAVAKIEEKVKFQEMKKALVNPFKIGDILYDSWGYNQSNIDFYEVVEIGNKSIKVRPIGQRIVEAAGDMCEYVVAVKGDFQGGAQTKVLQMLKDGRIYITSRYGWINLWDGNKKYQSHYA